MKAPPFLLLTAASLWAVPSPASLTTRYVDAGNQAPAAPYTNWLTAATNIQDAVNASALGDLVLVTNGFYQFGGAYVGMSIISNRVAVTKPITIQSLNGPAVTTILGSPGNVLRGAPEVRCVWLTNGAQLIGFTLTNGGVPSRQSGGGVYSPQSNPFTSTPSAVVSNCLITACSSAYYGGGAYGAFLDHCTIVGNSADTGGGVHSCALVNCTLSGNTATDPFPTDPSSACGGGAYHSILINCVITTNSAGVSGGGAYASIITNCLLVANSGYQGGGAFGGQLVNCTIVSNTASLSAGGLLTEGLTTTVFNSIVYLNSAPTAPNYQSSSPLSHCCTTPLPAGPANFTNNPALVNAASGDFHLQANSPCINAGINSAVASSTDLDGSPRIAGGTVDVGAYELQNPTSLISYAWLQQYGLPTDGSADRLDSDSDGMNNWQEWRAGTDPTDPLSVLRITSISITGAVATLRWQGAADVTYSLECSTNTLNQPAFIPVLSNIAGVGATIICPYTNATTLNQAYYRLQVQ
jgi:hypothetical protein